jgi:hypothetical protein
MSSERRLPGIRLEDRLTVRFPGRDASFRAGVEIGMVATLMALRHPRFERTIAADNIEQARALAAKLGYHLLSAEAEDDGLVRVTFAAGRPRPRLRLVRPLPEA